MKSYVLILATLMLQQPSFKETQLRQSRVKGAYRDKEDIVKKYFSDKGIQFGGFQLFLRAFKDEEKLEVWVKEKNKEKFSLLHTYDFCTSSGVLGPKRKEGDLQIPEGVYQINHFNPVSNFHLSLGLNYPNASDRILGDGQHPGGEIYIHGNCVTVGCIPITDDKIKELYTMAVEAKNNGQQKIPVHIYPTKLDETGLTRLKRQYTDAPKLLAFWTNLSQVYEDFEKTRQVHEVRVNTKGEYVINP